MALYAYPKSSIQAELQRCAYDRIRKSNHVRQRTTHYLARKYRIDHLIVDWTVLALDSFLSFSLTRTNLAFLRIPNHQIFWKSLSTIDALLSLPHTSYCSSSFSKPPPFRCRAYGQTRDSDVMRHNLVYNLCLGHPQTISLLPVDHTDFSSCKAITGIAPLVY